MTAIIGEDNGRRILDLENGIEGVVIGFTGNGIDIVYAPGLSREEAEDTMKKESQKILHSLICTKPCGALRNSSN